MSCWDAFRQHGLHAREHETVSGAGQGIPSSPPGAAGGGGEGEGAGRSTGPPPPPRETMSWLPNCTRKPPRNPPPPEHQALPPREPRPPRCGMGQRAPRQAGLGPAAARGSPASAQQKEQMLRLHDTALVHGGIAALRARNPGFFFGWTPAAQRLASGTGQRPSVRPPRPAAAPQSCGPMPPAVLRRTRRGIGLLLRDSPARRSNRRPRSPWPVPPPALQRHGRPAGAWTTARRTGEAQGCVRRGGTGGGLAGDPPSSGSLYGPRRKRVETF